MNKLILLTGLLFSLTSFAASYTFVMLDQRWPNKPFIAHMTGEEGVNAFEGYLKKGRVIRLENGDPEIGILIGPITKRTATRFHPWSYHFVPGELSMSDMTIELCDGNFQYLEENLDQWLQEVGNYCPWSTRSLVQKIYRNNRLIYSRK